MRVERAEALAGVRHGFLGRTGGVSTGLYESLNMGLGSGDSREAVAENRARAVAAVAPGARLVTLCQVHSARCVAAGEWADDARPEADALVTATPGLALGVLTADCAPVLLADVEAGVIGAAHAGWKGALSGVVEESVAAMERLGARRARIVGAIGPAIGPGSYEVGEEFRARFLQADQGAARFFVEGPRGRPHFDLPRYVEARLEAAGVGQCVRIDHDTCAFPERYFSYRRATLAGEPDYGRQLSLIALPDRAA
ncbi:peptidoglycan editing factor PgeF [Thermaurantiacus sp.]